MDETLRHLLESSRHDEAGDLLAAASDQDSLYRLSLLYRYLDRYEEEFELVSRCAIRDPNWEYMHRRKQWHGLPNYQRMEPRPPLRLANDSVDLPWTETLESMCFVTGGDSNYYPVMLECIESLKATARYCDIPVHIVDCGLSDSEKGQLSPLLSGGSIRQPDNFLDIREYHSLDKISGEPVVFEEPPSYHKLFSSKAFLNRIFSGYRYYFWINPNFWVQDERALDAFLKICESQGIAFPDASHGYPMLLKNAPLHRKKYIPKEYEKAVHDVRHGCDAVFCIKTEMLNEAQKIMWDFVHLNGDIYFYYFFELVQSAIVGRHRLNPDVPIDHYAHISHLVDRGCGYRPIIFDDNDHVIFKQQDPNRPIGLLRPIGFFDYDHDLFVQDQNNAIIGMKKGSTRYRTYPWKNRSRLWTALLDDSTTTKL